MSKFEFRNVLPTEGDEVSEIENICFPPNEACAEKNMKLRVANAADNFLVAYDPEAGKIAGFLNGVATDEAVFRDEFFTDITLHNPNGKNCLQEKGDNKLWKKKIIGFVQYVKKK